MSMSLAKVQILVNTEPFRSALIRAVRTINELPPEFVLRLRQIAEQRERERRRAIARRVHVQYHRKSRGHR